MSMTKIRRRNSAKTAVAAVGVAVATMAMVGSSAALAQQDDTGARRARADAVRGGMTVNRVVVEGSKKVEKTALLNELQARPFARVTNATLAADVERIKNIYNRVGRGYADVSYRVVDLPNGRYDVVFTVTEGDKTGVKAINFVGNTNYSSSRLRSLMTTTEMNFLSFFKNSDVYDPDRLASDQELIRRFYLKNGYADFQITSAEAYFDEAQGGYIVTITVDEGPQYRVGNVNVESRMSGLDVSSVEGGVSTSTGDVYNADAVEKSVQAMTNTAAKQGNAFAQVRPVGQRNPETHTVDIGYVVEEGPRVYIERINIRGNTRTRDYVIRREFDLGEGDAYNKVLMDRAERRLNNLGYFKKVRVTNEPGSGPDRVIVNVDVEDQPTGSFSVSGGYSTSDGFIGEVAVTETNFLGRGQYVRVAGSMGQRSKGIDFSFTEPYFLGYRMAAGFDLFSKYSDETKYARYTNRMTGGQIRLGLPITEEVAVTFRYSLYQQEMKIPNTLSEPYNDCTNPIYGTTVLNSDGSPNAYYCQNNGEASLAIKEAVGKTLTSLAGVTLTYNTLDNTRDPRNGLYVEVKPEVAGLGGDSKFFRVTGDARYYRELTDDIVGMVRLQGGHIRAFGGKDLRIVDNFFLGPTLVRGFAPSGIGPRDISTLDSEANAVGGTTYFGGSLEAQFPIPFLPRELGLKGAVFADAGTLFNYEGKTYFPNSSYNTLLEGYSPGSMCSYGNTGTAQNCIKVRDKNVIRSSIGASILWNSPLGPIRFDYAYALSKDDGVKVDGVRYGGDKTQAFRFSGGTRF
ncbi:outer membrane protein assembly factor BamA [Microvirga sp. W0021]|uniref:Outer membrane protein assembly factor BamA n=2 Tax=Hohaiivirga grylli TaxID=3133970 RepID=A0ABV0BIK5_9HYPH